jgi:simple sugar transport system permease protein
MDIITILATAIATSTPLIFASIGETITERAGVINLSAEGTILMSAMTGFAVTTSFLFDFCPQDCFQSALEPEHSVLLVLPFEDFS